MAQESHKSELIAQLAEARHGISASVRGLRRDVDVARRLEAVFQQHRLACLGGASLLGFLLTRLPARPKKVIAARKGRKAGTEEKVVKAGLLVTGLKIAFDLARPVLTKWLTRRAVAYAGERWGYLARPPGERG
jgi:hypothetical protein